MITKRIHISNVPHAIHDEVADEIARSSVGLSFVHTDSGKEHSRFVGSGTLVTLGKIEGIVTADHVITELLNCESLAVMCEISGPTRRHVIPAHALQFHRVAEFMPDCTGPDLAFVELPAQGIAYIRSGKTFYNIEKHLEGFEGAYEPVENGFWFGFGVIGETREDLGRDGPFEVLGYQAMCGMSGRPAETVKDPYDYLEILVDWENREADIPRSLGGMSGGGVWQALIAEGPDGKMSVQKITLSGVTFCQSAVTNGKRTLKCHGRRAIYENLREHFRKIGRYP